MQKIAIEVAYALPTEQIILNLDVAEGTNLEEAIVASQILQKYPEINLKTQKMGIFGKVKKAGEILRQGDRIEIYRPLIIDPKEARKNRAAKGKKLKKGGG